MTAVVWAGLEGSETGNALVDVIYGVVNPSGRLPYTIAKSPQDYPAQLVLGGNGEEILNITYSEGCVFCCIPFLLTVTVTGIFFCSLFVDYRHFDAANIAPRYEFGFGMSYTKFEYSGLSVIPVQDVGDDQDRQLEANWLAGKPGPRGVGSSTALWLHRAAYTVSFTVQNTGQVVGTEVRNSLSFPEMSELIARAKKNNQISQVYLHFPAGAGEPPSVLRGFTDVELQPGEGHIVNVTLSRYDLSVWDAPSQTWVRALGTYSLSVGASSRDFRLEGTLPL